MNRVLLRATGLVKKYGSKSVVNGIDLEVREKEVVAVIGPNGAGKSTTLDLILGLKRQDAGSVTFWRDDYKADVGVQLQSTPFFPGLSALDNLKLFAAFHKRKLSMEDGLRSWSFAACGMPPGRRLPGCPAVSRSGWRSPLRWCMTRNWCFWTNRRRPSTLGRGGKSAG